MSAFEELKESRNRLISLLPASQAMGAFHADHTETMDQYFRGSLQESEAGHRLFSKRTPFAFLAVGGYAGRSFLFIRTLIS